uniref:AD domain-containing protein n=1 Tax=Chlamydomonas leiostraca TaxID=1034604 RepID=A0A7S0RLT3_9CHLO|mmetsp:Transcript_26283/g.66913  ORF Transcript_26283/g.66913 Transcript_26283/m.66913 type:complete len:179 (+) Transcript_26283:178-714(+)
MAANPDSWGVGDSVVLRTTLGEEISSTVFGYDKATNMLMLRETGAHNGVANLRLLKASFIEKVVSLTKAAPGTVDLGPLPPVDMEKGKRREAKALKQAEKEAALVGVGVTKEAQSIFESLRKTLPCHWEGKDIVVLDEVVIKEPYTPNDCWTDAKHQATLNRVKMVLAAERTRLGLSA